MTKKTKTEDKNFTKSNERLWELLMRMKKSRKFQKNLKEIRLEFIIPPDGFLERPYNYPNLGSKFFKLPEKWKKIVSEKRFTELVEKWNNILDDYELGPLRAYPSILYGILFYNIYILPENIDNMIVVDMVKIHRDMNFNNLKENYIFPVAILINPYASRDDLEDFLKNKKNLRDIRILQKKYLEKTPTLNKIRMRESSEITKFILKNKEEKPKEIIRLLKKEFNTTNYGESDIRRTIYYHTKAKHK